MKFLNLAMFLAAANADEFVFGVEPCFWTNTTVNTTVKSNCTSTCFPNCTAAQIPSAVSINVVVPENVTCYINQKDYQSVIGSGFNLTVPTISRLTFVKSFVKDTTNSTQNVTVLAKPANFTSKGKFDAYVLIQMAGCAGCNDSTRTVTVTGSDAKGCGQKFELVPKVVSNDQLCQGITYNATQVIKTTGVLALTDATSKIVQASLMDTFEFAKQPTTQQECQDACVQWAKNKNYAKDFCCLAVSNKGYSNVGSQPTTFSLYAVDVTKASMNMPVYFTQQQKVFGMTSFIISAPPAPKAAEVESASRYLISFVGFVVASIIISN